MSALLSPEALGNVLRLKGLKNVNGRKVMPGAEFLQALEQPETDVQGISQPPIETGNMPETDLGGELTSQSYDVRANASPSPEIPQEEPGFFSKLGRALGDYVNPQKREEMSQYQKALNLKAQNPSLNIPQEPLPIANEEMQASIGQLPEEEPEQQGGFWSNLYEGLKKEASKPYFEPFGTEAHLYGKEPSENKTLIENAQMRAKGLNPEVEAISEAEALGRLQEREKEQLERAQENPGENVVYGATNKAFNQTDFPSISKKYLGVDLSEQDKELTEKYEQVIGDLQTNNDEALNNYDADAARIRERILKNSATDMDKYYIGLALLMPLLAGAFFGKEAAIGALGGAAKGFSEGYERKQKSITQDEQALADIMKLKSVEQGKKGEYELEKLKIPEQVKKNLPKDVTEHLKGTEQIIWQDPMTGEEKMGFELKPNFVANPKYIGTEKKLLAMDKKAEKLAEDLVPVKNLNELTDDIVYLSSQLSDEDRNLLTDFMTSYILGKKPDLASYIGRDKKVDFKGRKVNAITMLSQQIGLLVDSYRQTKNMRALTNTVQEHFDSLLKNPATTLQSFQDTIDQMEMLRDMAQNDLINKGRTQGFEPEFLIKEFSEENKKFYGNLNKKAGEKEAHTLLEG